jgi:GR25 family glycosyltransferase involved in LPS biosynthesis
LKSYAIIIKENAISEFGFKNLLNSAKSFNLDFTIDRFNAVTHENSLNKLKELNITWNYPDKDIIYDNTIKLTKMPYVTKVKEKRIACSLSHYLIWKESHENNIPILVFEHDSIIINKIDKRLFDEKYSILGINDPRGATRKSNVFHNIVQKSVKEFLNVPIIDDMKIPQGLAGNSAYIIKPEGAKKLLDLVEDHGLWPNDAIMCQQLVPNMYVTKTYYTKVQGLESTTTL